MERFAIKCVISSIDTIQHAVLTFACTRDVAPVFSLAIQGHFKSKVEKEHLVRFQETRIYDALSRKWLPFTNGVDALSSSNSESWPWYESTGADWAVHRILYRPYETVWENVYSYAVGFKYAAFLSKKRNTRGYLD